MLSLFLTKRLVEDPPYLKAEREKSRGIGVDWTGLGLIALGIGCLQVALDKGQELDWFASPAINMAFATALICAGVIGVVGVASQGPDCGREAVPAAQFRDGDGLHFRAGHGALRDHGADSAVPAIAAGILGGEGGRGDLRRGTGDDGDDADRGHSGVARGSALHDGVRLWNDGACRCSTCRRT